jgi:hypothetical protein
MKFLKHLILVSLVLMLAHEHSFASSGGIIGAVQVGCTCHGGASSGTSLSIPGQSSAITVKTGETLSLTLLVAHGAQNRAGMNLAVVNASGANAGVLQAGSGSQIISGQLTHAAPQSISNGSASFPFQWTAPSTPGTFTLRAVGNAVNGDGSTGGDAWNSLAPITITVEDATPTTFSISGRILNPSGVAVAGVTVSDGTRSAVSDAQGNYTISDVPNGTYTLTPSLANWIFEPTTISVTVNGTNVQNQNITGRRLWSVSGTITTPAGVPVVGAIVLGYSGTSTTISSSATTDAQGNYTLWLVNGAYSVVAKQTNWVFEPTSVAVTVNGANILNQNITGRRLWAVSGQITNPAGAPVVGAIVLGYSGTSTTISSSATTDAQGNYTLWLVNGAYSVVAKQINWIFEPASLSVTVNGANLTGQNISGRRLWAISGQIVNPNGEGVANVSVSALVGINLTSVSTATTDAQGNYTLWLVNGAYNITPSRTNWLFTPSVRAARVDGANQTLESITGRLTMSVKNVERLASVQVAPNPVSDVLHISFKLPSPQRIRIEVFSLLGERVRFFMEQALSGQEQVVLPIQGLVSGMYMLRLSLDDGTVANTRFMVKGQ